MVIQNRYPSSKRLVYSPQIDPVFVHDLRPSDSYAVRVVLTQVAILSAYCATCLFIDNAFGRSCIRMVNKIGAIIEPCGPPMSMIL